ncbi:MAG: DUF4331 domain-containing protein [Planctomycetota bacterium]
MRKRTIAAPTAVATVAAVLAAVAYASSHREAPAITESPKVDATDFYMFRSYETGREDYVTLVANYLPLQDPYGGPNYFALDPDALYEIHIDNDGDAIEDLTFQFRFDRVVEDRTLMIGAPGEEVAVAVPLVNIGDATLRGNVQARETFSLTLVTGDRRSGVATPIAETGSGLTEFEKPLDNIGAKSFMDYASYADAFVYDIDLPGGAQGRMFVGQRKDPFVVNLGETFDLVNTNPLGPVNGETDSLADKNVTSFILEIPITFLTDGDPVIGGWTSASLRQARVLNPRPTDNADVTVEGGAWTQVSRLGSPLVNEVVIGYRDKDRFNASEPKDDAQFLTYVTNPTLPTLLEVLFGVTAPTAYPRNDLVQVFLTGVDGLTKPIVATPGEMLRLNTATPTVAKGSQNNLGVIGGDVAGFPNGRRPGDDVVDVSLRAVMGVLLPMADAPDGQLPYTDGAFVDDSFFGATFPYLATPLGGSPN